MPHSAQISKNPLIKFQTDGQEQVDHHMTRDVPRESNCLESLGACSVFPCPLHLAVSKDSERVFFAIDIQRLYLF